MRPSFIYFDLDNTLLHHSDAETRAQQATYNQFPELRKVDFSAWLSEYKLVNSGLWKQYQKNEIDRHMLQMQRFKNTMMNLSLDTSRSIEIGRAYMQNYRKYWEWVQGAQNAISELSKIYPVGIITNGFKETQEKKFEALSLTDYCNTFVISEEIGVMKPHPDVFDYATNLAQTERENILYVGDSYSSDIIGGSRAGWKTAWFTSLTRKNGNEELADFEFTEFEMLLSWIR